MVRLTIFSLALFTSFLSFGQFGNQNTWSYSLYLGGSNMLGDLGGSNQSGTSGIKDIDLNAVRAAVGGGLHYHVRNMTYGANVFFTHLVGDDAFTDIQGRTDRNLSVRTDLIEANFLVEIAPFKSFPILNRVYFNGGIGGAYFQPKAKYNDEWVKLRPLGTEGQNFLNGQGQYSKVAFVIPFGAGYKFRVGQFTSINLDLSMRKTFTDYLDDVSTVYANSAAIAAEAGGQVASALADRSVTGFAEGSQRGSANSNDNYFFVGLKFQRTIGAKRLGSCTNFDAPNRKTKKRKKSNASKRFYL